MPGKGYIQNVIKNHDSNISDNYFTTYGSQLLSFTILRKNPKLGICRKLYPYAVFLENI